jgi:outer membrane protein insertion porin family
MYCRLAIAAVLALIFAASAFAADAVRTGTAADPAIVVSGSRHTDAAMIRSYFHRGRDGRLDAEALDAALKGLYATGLFRDVNISRSGSRIAVKVIENPTIGRIAFEGNRKVKDAGLKKALRSKPGGPMWRFFVQDDVAQLTELYRQHGYFQAQIKPQTITAKGGRVNLVFAIKEGDKLAVREIQFAGNKAFPRYKLTGVIKTGKSNFLSFLLDNDIYNADRIAADCGLLRTFYRAHGYADVRVRSAASYDAARKGVVLRFTIDEGPQYRLGKVAIDAAVKSVDAGRLRDSLRTRSGGVYDAGAVDKTIDDLTMKLARSGQPFARVIAHQDREPPSAATRGAALINLLYTIEPGKRLYVERIEIHGDTKTRDEVVRRAFEFGEGDAYNRALIDRAERRLKALGYFKSVNISSKPGSAPDRVILEVAVKEQDTGDFSIMGGYSTTDGWMAEIGVSDTNFMGLGYVTKTKVTYGQYARGLDLGFTDPYFLGQPMSGGVELFGNETFANTNQSYDSTVYGAKLSLGTPLNDQLGVTWNYSIYNQGVTLDPTQGTSSLPIQQAAAQGAIWVSSVGATVTYSTLDDAKNPTSGIRLQTSDDVAGLGGAAKFARTTEDVRYYHPIAGDVVGMVRAQTGYVTPWGGQSLPLLDGFFGGPQLVRGFAVNGFGPRDVTPGTTMDNLGGNIYWTTSAELEAPVPGVPADAHLKMALFSDVGSLWATGASSASSLAALSPSQQIANSRAPRASIGTALIWDSPFGALQVDYAYPILKQPSDVTQRLSFTAGAF